MKLIRSFLTKNPCYVCNRDLDIADEELKGKYAAFQKNGPKGLMLHSVGCSQPSAMVFVNSWNNAEYKRACVHAFIDAFDGTVHQTLPWNYRGWHGGGASNDTHVGIEMCEPACIKYTGGAAFICQPEDLKTARETVKRTYDAAVELFAYLCKEYKLDPLEDGVIISHKEGHTRGIASGHADPEHIWDQLGTGLTMSGFRSAVKKALDEIKEE